MKKLLFIFLLITLSPSMTVSQTWEDLIVSMSEAYQQNNLKEATKIGYQSLDLAAKEFGKEHDNYFTSLESVALMHFYSRDFIKAIPLFKQSMEFRYNKYGETSSQYILSYVTLANSYNNSAQKDSAEHYYKGFIALCRKYNAYKHASYIPTLNNLGYLYFLQFKYKEALPYMKEVANLRKEFLGEKDLYYAKAEDNLAEVYKKMGDFKNASKTKQSAHKSYMKIYAASDSSRIEVVGRSAVFFNLVANYKKADTLFNEYVSYYRMKNIDSLYAGALESYGYYLRERGDFDKAENIHKEALKIRALHKAKQPNRFLDAANFLARVYIDKDDFENGNKLLKGIRNIDKYKKFHKGFVAYYNNLGLLNKRRGHYDEAIEYYSLALKYEKKYYSDSSLQYATILDNTGNLYGIIGRFDKAESCFQQSIKIFQKYGEKQQEYKALNNYATLYKSMGNYEEAASYYEKALEIAKQYYGENHYYYALTMDNLAMTYSDIGNTKLAEQYSTKALKSYKNSIGENSVDYAIALQNAATLLHSKRKHNKIRDYYLQALDILEKTYGKKHHTYALTLSNLGLNYHENEKLDSAENIYLESLELFKQTVGEYHPSYATTLSLLAQLYEEKGNIEDAKTYYLESSGIRLQQIKQNFHFLNEVEKEKYWLSFNESFDMFNSFTERNQHKFQELKADLYNNLLVTKGLLLKSNTILRNKILYSGDSLLIKKFEKWLYNKELIGKLEQLTFDEQKNTGIQLDSLKEKTDILEKDLNKSSQLFENESLNEKTNWKKIKDKLKKKEIAIEFFTYNEHFQNFTGKTIYAALILKKDYDYPKLIKICDEEGLSEILKETDDRYHVHKYVIDSTLNRNLFNLIWQPIDSLVSRSNKVYLSLDGLLNKISYASLVTGNNQLLINAYDLQFLSSTSKIAEERTLKSKLNKSITLFGGIDYFPEKEELQKAATQFTKKWKKRGIPSRSIPRNLIKGNVWWSYLDGTLEEVKTIDSIFIDKNWQSTILTGATANEEAFKTLQGKESPSVIHISTHGYFLPDEEAEYLKENQSNRGLAIGDHSTKKQINPLYRSGLIFAGANRVWGGGNPIEGLEDGVLTAYEASNTYLGNTELVVLSACETGLGEIKSGEGVYGLQRSFQLAGAESIIMSLWQVPDKETVELMQYFYKYWLQSGNKHNAFRKAQLHMSKKYHPFYWAAFMMLE